MKKILSLVILLFTLLTAHAQNNEAIATMKMSEESIRFSVKTAEDVVIDWGDGTQTTVKASGEERGVSHKYDTYNDKTVIIMGDVTALIVLYINQKGLTEFDASNSIALKELSLAYNELTTLDVSKNVALESLWVDHNIRLNSLNISNNAALKTLNVSNCELTSLDVSKNKALKALDVSWNRLSAINISENTKLIELSLSNNQLTTLDLSKNIALQTLDVSNNKLTALDVSNHADLIEILAVANQLTTLDVSNNAELRELAVSNNPLALNAAVLLDLANSLPDKTGKTSSLLYIQAANAQAQAIATSKNWRWK